MSDDLFVRVVTAGLGAAILLIALCKTSRGFL